MRGSWWESDPKGIAFDAVHKFGAIQKHEELAQFIEVLAGLDPLDIIVEIGSYAGGTLWAWGQLAPTVIGVDLPPVSPDSVYAATGGPQNPHGAHMVFGDSHDPLTLQTLNGVLNGRPVDALFIDGDHSYAGVKADYEMYAPLVRPGGVIGFHDIVTHEGADVARWWQTLTVGKAEIVADGEPWGGIGIIRVEEKV